MDLREPLALVLVFVPAAALTLLAARRSAVGLSRLRARLSLAARLLLLLALALVAADARAVLPNDERAVVFVLDASDSIAPGDRRHMRDWVARAWEGRQPADRAGLVVFGSRARVEQPLGRDDPPDELGLEGLPRDRTSIAGGLRAAAGLLREETGERWIVLLSDGNAEEPDRTVAEAMALASAGIPVTTVAVELTPSPREVLVGAVSAPQLVSVDEPFLLKVEVVAQSGGPATVHVVRNGRYEERDVDLAPGINRITLPQRLEAPDAYVYEVSVSAEGDGNPANNTGGAIVRVRGRPRVLVIQGPAVDPASGRRLRPAEVAAPLRTALEGAGFEVVVEGPHGLPLGLDELAGFGALVLGDVGAERWTPEQMDAVRRYVFDTGGGLVALGGEEAYGLGGYYGTPIEEALPVSADVRGKKILPSLALLFCLDHSGSMSDVVGTVRKLDLAKEGAIRSLELLQPVDQVGVVAFSDEPEWVVDMTPVRDAEAIARQIAGIDLAGGTALAPVLREAHAVLSRVPAQIRHAVLLTDGVTPEDPALLLRFSADLRRDKISLTTVGVGHGVDKALLARLAEGTGGRFLWAADARAIPRLLTKDAVTASKALLVERPVQPRLVGDLGLDLDWSQAPPLLGFVITAAKPEAEVLLDSGPEETAEDGPLLVRWRYGLGRAVAFTSDAAARWSAPWLTWSGYPTLFGSLLRWVVREEAVPGITTDLELAQGQGRVLVRARDADGAPRHGLDLRARVVPPPGAPEVPLVRLDQTGPGLYEGEFQATRPGPWFTTVEARGGGDGEAARPVGSAGAVLAYPREYRHLTSDLALLERVARLTQGEVLTVDDDPTRVFGGERLGRPTSASLAAPLFAVAGLLLLLDVAARRLTLPERVRRWLEGGGAGSAERPRSGGLIERLRARKEAEREAAASRRRRRVEVEAGPVDAPAEPQPAATPLAEAAAAPERPEPAPPPPARPARPAPPPRRAPPVDDGSPMSKLLQAKRQARDRSDRPREGE